MEKKFKKGDEIVVEAEVVDTQHDEDVLLQIAESHYSNLPGFAQTTANLCNNFLTSKENIVPCKVSTSDAETTALSNSDAETTASSTVDLTIGTSVFVKVLFEKDIADSIYRARALRSNGESSYFTLPESAILGCSDMSDGGINSHRVTVSTVARRARKRCTIEFLDGQKEGMLIVWNLMKMLVNYDEKMLKESFGYRTLPGLLANRYPEDALDHLLSSKPEDALNLLTECTSSEEQQSTKGIVKL